MPTSLLWFRRDLRPAACAAAGPDGAVLPLVVLDPRFRDPAGGPRRRFVLDCLADLREQTGGAPVLRTGLEGESAAAYANEPAWREFYADVLWHRPETHREAFDQRRGAMTYDTRPDGVPEGHPLPVGDHAEERRVALDRYERVRRA